MTALDAEEKVACLYALAGVAKLNGDPTPREFEDFLAALDTFRPLPPGITPEGLFSKTPPIDDLLARIQPQSYSSRSIEALVLSPAPRVSILKKQPFWLKCGLPFSSPQK
jgi:hypothetical protein